MRHIWHAYNGINLQTIPDSHKQDLPSENQILFLNTPSLDHVLPRQQVTYSVIHNSKNSFTRDILAIMKFLSS